MPALRLAELIAPLSQVSDLGMGQPVGTAIRTCVLATGLASRMALPTADRASVYYASLLQHIGCTAYAHETAQVAAGDDIGFRASGMKADPENARESISFLLHGVGAHAPPLRRAQAVWNVARLGPAFRTSLYAANCEVAIRAATSIGLPSTIRASLGAMYARWDGKGVPSDLAGDAIPVAARVVHVASQAELFGRIGGVDLLVPVIRQRSGSWLDPSIADALIDHAEVLLADLDAVDPTIAVLDAEPSPRLTFADARIDDIARVFATVTDLKSPWLHGHSVGVADLAERAAIACGLPESEAIRLRRAGCLHDLGRVGVATGIWNKPGPLTRIEWEAVRLHAYHSERILAQSPALADLAAIAGMHHERIDGSGYHRQAAHSAIPMPARLLAAADAFQAMTQSRPYRPARSPGQASEALLAEVRRGRLDAEAARAVLEAAGVPRPTARTHWPAGLTNREVEVLRLASRGLTNRQIGAALSISPKTAGHHIQHVYAKAGVSTRAGAAMFAMEHQLVDPVHPSEK